VAEFFLQNICIEASDLNVYARLYDIARRCGTIDLEGSNAIVCKLISATLQKYLNEYYGYHQVDEKSSSNIANEETLENVLQIFDIIRESIKDNQASGSAGKDSLNTLVINFKKSFTLNNESTSAVDLLPKAENEEVFLNNLLTM
jgi:hypothetical protein